MLIGENFNFSVIIHEQLNDVDQSRTRRLSLERHTDPTTASPVAVQPPLIEVKGGGSVSTPPQLASQQQESLIEEPTTAGVHRQFNSGFYDDERKEESELVGEQKEELRRNEEVRAIEMKGQQRDELVDRSFAEVCF